MNLFQPMTAPEGHASTSEGHRPQPSRGGCGSRGAPRRTQKQPGAPSPPPGAHTPGAPGRLGGQLRPHPRSSEDGRPGETDTGLSPLVKPQSRGLRPSQQPAAPERHPCHSMSPTAKQPGPLTPHPPEPVLPLPPFLLPTLEAKADGVVVPERPPAAPSGADGSEGC